MRKMIYLILDCLLVLGAIACVVTIDGGKWWLGDLTTHTSIAAVGYRSTTAFAADNASMTLLPDRMTRTVTDCRKIILPSAPDSYDKYLLLQAYYGNGKVQNMPGSRVSTCR